MFKDYSDTRSVATAPLLHGLETEEIRKIVSQATRKEWDTGDWVLRQGDPSKHVFLLESGRVRIYHVTPDGHDVLLNLVAPGDTFGFEVSVDHSTYLGSARAVQPSRALVWTIDAIRELMVRYPRLALNALEELIASLHGCASRYSQLVTEPVEQRIATSLVQLAKRYGRVSGHATVINKFSPKDLADLAGTTIYTVSRVLSEWQRRGLISKSRGQITLLQRIAC